MREVIGDLFTYPADAVCIPVNWTVKRNGHAVMGAGVALQAARRWPDLPFRLGDMISVAGASPTLLWFGVGSQHLVAFPTKRDWRDPSDIDLIAAMAQRLNQEAGGFNWQTVALPRLGCGLGGLAWSDVRAVLAPLLDDRFVVLTPTAPMGAQAPASEAQAAPGPILVSEATPGAQDAVSG